MVFLHAPTNSGDLLTHILLLEVFLIQSKLGRRLTTKGSLRLAKSE